jgi:glycine/D-amino acid oxidase-like deaminating enzyme
LKSSCIIFIVYKFAQYLTTDQPLDRLKQKVDFLIVGQGIAGTVLSWELIKAGASIHVINKESNHTSSMVAAGIYNPITGHKMAKTWKADELFPVIEPLYKEIGNAIGHKILYDCGVYRPFISIAEGNDWEGRKSSGLYDQFLAGIYHTSIRNEAVKDTFGGLMLKTAGYVDVAGLIFAFRNWLKEERLYQEGSFDESLLELSEKGICYENIEAKKVIFCQGVSGTLSHFDWLPFKPVKGELMDVSSDASFDFILNRGAFMVSIGNSLHRLGATYRWNLEGGFQVETEEELIEKIKNVFKGELKVIEKKFGIRPATKDRRPFIGIHPNIKQLAMFNGFGSKGVSLTPYFGAQFVRHLLQNEPIDSEVDIKRYF